MATERYFKNSCNACGAWGQSFESINELARYITNQPLNKVYKMYEASQLNSAMVSKRRATWSGTRNLTEAMQLLKFGDKDVAQTLTKKLQIEKNAFERMPYQKQISAIAGYQPIVANYLANMPNAMVSKKVVTKKQKIINIVRQGAFSSSETAKTLQEEGIKTFLLIKKLEAQGYRVNLYLVFTELTKGYKNGIMLSIKLKGANEPFNVSKLAFPICNPSMLRRIYLAWAERYPHIYKDFEYTYGIPCSLKAFKQKFEDIESGSKIFPKNSYGIENKLGFDVEKVSNLTEKLVRLG